MMNKIIHGNCLDILPTFDDNSVDAVVTDPPYELGFMNKGWDASGIAYSVDMWRECLRVLKPGGHLLSFGGSRTYHRMACAIEDAGFEIRDQIQYIYGSGFPKSQNISKAIDKAAGAERAQVGVYITPDGRDYTKEESCQRGYNKTELSTGKDKDVERRHITAPATPEAKQWEGWGSALKPAHEPIVLARKPLSEKTIAANVLKWGTGGINIDGCRVETEENLTRDCNGFVSSVSYDHQGYGDDAVRAVYGSITGRFPANLIHDGSDEVVQGFPQTVSGSGIKQLGGDKINPGGWKEVNRTRGEYLHGDSGSAARFFYCAKASKAERNMGCGGLEDILLDIGDERPSGESWERRTGKKPTPTKNSHPTVKPLALMRYLCRLITPPNGTVLDPFAGSGSTLIAAKQEGFSYMGIEMEAEYIQIAECRLSVEVEKQETLF